MTNYSTGHDAEKYAADYLLSHGFKIRDLNWRTRYCEIDIVAEKDNTMHFVEVKYRKTESAGSGLEYITPSKLKQMKFSAEMWVHEHDWSGDYTLSAIEVAGEEFEITNFISEI